MRFDRIRIEGLRCISQAAVELGEGIQVFVGANGAGKTSVLEAAHLLSHGRSFRSGAREALLQRGSASLAVFAEARTGDGSVRRLGLGRAGVQWQARLDGADVPLNVLVQACAVVCFEPGSHALIAGPADERRRFLDWGVFHVEHAFLGAWRRYQRALKQRNALLRAGAGASAELFLPWERELDEAGSAIDSCRQGYIEQLAPRISASARSLLAELGATTLRYKRGWPEGASLSDVLAEQRGRDMARGHTSAGPHRADWSLGFEAAPLREHLSRGQEKLAALSCLLAQGELHAACTGDWPVVGLDDLASELDLEHQAALIERLAAAGAQVLVTGTDCPELLKARAERVFHVEQGRITPLL